MHGMFFDITKRDDEQRIVTGYAMTEAKDAQGEVVKLDCIKDALDEYMKFGNVREMHKPSAVGVVEKAEMDDKGLLIEAKIVDDSAWEKVKNGVYKGFSIGGKALKRGGGVLEKMLLTEISLVDRPCNPEALISVFKLDTARVVAQISTLTGMLANINSSYRWNDDLRKGDFDAIEGLIVQEIKTLTEQFGVEKADIDNQLERMDLFTGIDAVVKAGSRNSKSDAEHIQHIHDKSCTLGAACGVKKSDDNDDVQKLMTVEEVKKSLDAVAEQIKEARTVAAAEVDDKIKLTKEQIEATLQEVVNKFVEGFAPLHEAVEKMLKQPLPTKTGTGFIGIKVVDKTDEMRDEEGKITKSDNPLDVIKNIHKGV